MLQRKAQETDIISIPLRPQERSDAALKRLRLRLGRPTLLDATEPELERVV